MVDVWKMGARPRVGTDVESGCGEERDPAFTCLFSLGQKSTNIAHGLSGMCKHCGQGHPGSWDRGAQCVLLSGSACYVSAGLSSSGLCS
jgi:hypothetical protein